VIRWAILGVPAAALAPAVGPLPYGLSQFGPFALALAVGVGSSSVSPSPPRFGWAQKPDCLKHSQHP